MTETTIISLAILGGVFLLMAITLIKHGTAHAIKLWSVMGSLTGVAFGAMTTYYFTKQATQGQIDALQAQVVSKDDELNYVAEKAKNISSLLVEARFLKPIPSMLESKGYFPLYPGGDELLKAELDNPISSNWLTGKPSWKEQLNTDATYMSANYISTIEKIQSELNSIEMITDDKK
ncbi:hypothetical protein NOK90_25735 [Vibrio parahaemolyticus]|uniref:hypothetical protein n=1 Tax=Vibrio parahaemolyticus TaxID=670 RepID=UPI00226BB115|nr:hypothetical protein [Vibrio parahaemolyticus]MCX8794135.1 hypothetical protein [Vibrio parahaemolyticus]